MKKDRLKQIDFYMVTDSNLSKKGALNDVEQAIKAGCIVIQYREKNKSKKELINEALKIKIMCEDKAFFLINDMVDVAMALDADGIHIGQDDMPYEMARELIGDHKIIGLTVHNLEEAIHAETIGADYIGISPIFETATKTDAGKACGTSMISEVRRNIHLPIVAIGGITKINVHETIEAGADAAAAISAIVCSDDVYNETLDFINIIKNAKTKSATIKKI